MSLKVYCGPMFSSKSTTMLGEINKLIDVNKGAKALIINHKLDNRDAKHVVSSHSSLYQGLNNNFDIQSTSKLSAIDVTNYTIIGIDEINFFDDKDDLVSTIKLWISNNKHIIAVGLDGDSNMNKFGHISELLHLADAFVKLTAFCTPCINDLLKNNHQITPYNTTPAPFTRKLIHNDQVIEVGGENMYQSCCRLHHC